MTATMPLPELRQKKKFSNFDPSSIAVDNGNIYALPFTEDTASVIIIPVPWEVTVSYRTGTARGPEALRAASLQVDLYDEEMGDVWRHGIYMPPHAEDIYTASQVQRKIAADIIEHLARGDLQEQFAGLYAGIERQFDILYARLEAGVLGYLQRSKIVGIAGGDHSVSLGALRAYARHFESFGILHIDAHADLRDSYEGFVYSHASIMYNALAVPQVARIVQVGIRDYCSTEVQLIEASKGRVKLFSDAALKDAQFGGRTWSELCDEIIACLPELIYISFDIDGLDPALCPGTGTPVPGGLSFQEAVFLLNKITHSGRKIIGFDLVEVAGDGDSWDAIVGARLLYKLCCRAIASYSF
jgi:agmatinase